MSTKSFAHVGLRPSLAPVAKQCPSAMYIDPNRPEIRTVTNEVFSATGSALHAIFKDIIYPGLPVTTEALEPYLDQFGVVMEGYFGILWRAKKVAEKWAKVAQHYQGATLEQRISCTLDNGYELAGTPDLYNVLGDFALVFDLKGGEQDIDYMDQVELYALILYKKNKALGLKSVYGALFHPMLDKYKNEEITEQRLIHIEEFWIKWMAFAGIQYVVGPKCAYCPRILTCPAILKSVDPMVAEIVKGRELTSLDIRNFRPTIKYLKKIVEGYDLVEKALLERMGVIDLGDGNELYLKTDFQDKLKALEAFHVLTGEFKIPAEKVIEQMKISKDAVKEAAKAIAIPRDRTRGLGVTQVKILNALEAQGATYKKPRVTVTTRPIPDKQITQ